MTKTPKNLVKSESGAVMVIFGLCFMLLIAVVGAAMDIGRHAAIRSKAQSVLDASLLSAVSRVPEDNPIEVAKALFLANYPEGYLGSEVESIIIFSEKRLSNFQPGGLGTNPGLEPGEVYTGKYNGTVKIKSPNYIMGLFTKEEELIQVTAQAMNDLTELLTKVQVAFVLDNTGSMAGQPIEDLKQAVHYAVDLLTNNETSDNVYLSLIPYAVSVAFLPAEYPQAGASGGWTQTFWQPRQDYRMSQWGKYYLANRNKDNPVSSHEDITNVAPTNDDTKFRTPGQYINGSLPFNNGSSSCADLEIWNQAPMLFAEQNPGALHSRIDLMVPNGCTRVNVGALWGWMALSDTWQGIWSASKPTLPLDKDPNHKNFMVIMTDGLNTVYNSSPQFRDDNKLSDICFAAKADGVIIYSITLGPAPDVALMQACATDAAHYYHAPSSNQLAEIFEDIAIDIQNQAVTLTK